VRGVWSPLKINVACAHAHACGGNSIARFRGRARARISACPRAFPAFILYYFPQARAELYFDGSAIKETFFRDVAPRRRESLIGILFEFTVSPGQD